MPNRKSLTPSRKNINVGLIILGFCFRSFAVDSHSSQEKDVLTYKFTKTVVKTRLKAGIYSTHSICCGIIFLN
jgi:hypothetical protein